MTRFVRIVTTEGPRHASRAYQAVAAQPSWIVRVATFVFIIVVGLPLLLLVLLALLAAALVFVVLGMANRLILSLRGILPRHDGRENVRIIRREPPDAL